MQTLSAAVSQSGSERGSTQAGIPRLRFEEILPFSGEWLSCIVRDSVDVSRNRVNEEVFNQSDDFWIAKKCVGVRVFEKKRFFMFLQNIDFKLNRNHLK